MTGMIRWLICGAVAIVLTTALFAWAPALPKDVPTSIDTSGGMARSTPVAQAEPAVIVLPWPVREAQTVVDAVIYVRDQRSGICFAYAPSATGRDARLLAYVPCTMVPAMLKSWR